MEKNTNEKRSTGKKEKIRYKYEIFNLHRGTAASIYPVDEMKEKMNEGFLKYDCPSRQLNCEKLDNCCSSDYSSHYVCGSLRSPDPIFNTVSHFISDKVNNRRKNYVNAFYKEDRPGPFSRVTHDPILLYIIHPKYSKTNTTAYQFFSMDSNEVEDEVERLNKSFGKDYWMYTPDDANNKSMVSLKHQFELEVSRINIEN
jgi:hypothetical protein